MWPDSNQTHELLKQAECGDGDAVSRLLERHREPLRRAIHMRLDRAIERRVDASDIVQEVLIDASRRLPEYLKNPVLPFHLWLRQIARDRLVDAHRRHRRAERRAVDREQPIELAAFLDRSSIDLAADLRDRQLTPAAAAIRKELARRFHGMLDRLDEDDRELLLMRYFEQLSNSEVAAALGISEPAAGMRHLRALRRLRELLGETPSQASKQPVPSPQAS
jgi:RNA polymerase sigma-70 factor (ECF subfamily)